MSQPTITPLSLTRGEQSPRDFSQQATEKWESGLFIVIVQDGVADFKADTECDSVETFEANGGAHVLSLRVHCNGQMKLQNRKFKRTKF